MMRVKITSDGTTHGTKVVDVGSGKEVRGITRLHLDVKAGEPMLVEMTLLAQAEVDMITNAKQRS